MRLPASEIEFVEMRGLNIPDEMEKLTNGMDYGLMAHWLKKQRTKMGCIALKHNGVFVAWCAYVLRDGDRYSVGTYVAEEYRMNGIAKELVGRTLDFIARISPGATVKCGGSSFNKFDSIYEEMIVSRGLKNEYIFENFSEEFENLNEAA